VIAVDDFAPQSLSPHAAAPPKPPATKRPRAKPIAEPTVVSESRTFGDRAPPD